MNTLRIFITSLCIAATAIVYAAPAQVNVIWSNPAEYKDIRTSGVENQAEFEQRLFASLEKTLTDEATKLPDDYRLDMQVNNLTLAGENRFSGPENNNRFVRLYKDGYPARMEFHYALHDNEGKVVKEGDESIKSPNFKSTISRTTRNQPFEVEKKMLGTWFRNTLLK